MPHSASSASSPRRTRTKRRKGPRPGGRPAPGSVLHVFYEACASRDEPTPLVFHEGSTQVGAHGESDPVHGADTSQFAPSQPLEVRLLKKGLQVPDPEADLTAENSLEFPTPLHAYVYMRMRSKTFPAGLRTAVRTASLEELQSMVGKRTEWLRLLLQYGKTMKPATHEARRWTKAKWDEAWYKERLPAWYRQVNSGGVSEAQKCWRRILTAATQQHPAFARAVCATGERTLALRRCAVNNPALVQGAAPEDQTNDIITRQGDPGAYGAALMDVRTALRREQPELAAVADAYFPYANGPHEGGHPILTGTPPSSAAAAPQSDSDSAHADGTDAMDVDMDVDGAQEPPSNEKEGDEPGSASEASEPVPFETTRAGGKKLRQMEGMDVCASCDKEKPSLACLTCLQVAYCNRTCQVAHWPTHVDECAELAATRPEVLACNTETNEIVDGLPRTHASTTTTTTTVSI